MTVLTHQEAAAFLKVNDATLRKLRRRGDIQGTLVGAQYRYLREHLEDYLQGMSGSTTVQLSESRADLATTVDCNQPAIDQPKRPVHHRAFYSLPGRNGR